MEKWQAISDLRQSFPGFPANTCSRQFEKPADPIANSYEFARFVTTLFAHGDPKQTQRVFDRVEDFMQTGSAELRDWVCSFLDAVQDIATWKLSGSDVFLRFLGSETRRAWGALEAIRRDLEDCPALEAEVLMWRIVHHDAQSPARVV
jgi:hypothetical protein